MAEVSPLVVLGGLRVDTKFLERVVSTVESHLELKPSTVEFEMAYQAKIATERIRFVIRLTDQPRFEAEHLREASLQLLDALDRLESLDKRFQERSRLGELGRASDRAVARAS
jgi:hypothetical protein